MRKTRWIMAGVAALLVAVFMISLTVGSYPLSGAGIGRLLTGRSSDAIAQQVFYNLRVPRVAMGLLSGIVLGVAGGVYQLIFANPLASPDLTGVASGASLGAAVAIVAGSGSTLQRMFGAFFMGVAALLFVLLLIKITGVWRTAAYILAGLVVSALADAGLMVFKYMADPVGELAAIEFWTMGSLSAVTLNQVQASFAGALVPLVFVLLCRRQIVLLSLGDENARYLGLNAGLFRMSVLILTTWMVASVISVTGAISFIGLIAPHIAYLILGRRTGCFLLLSGCIGGVVIMTGDILARSLISGAELPLSILTVFFAAPVLVFWMWRQRGQLL